MRIKPLLLFLVLLTVPVAYFFDDATRQLRTLQIQRSPSYATATFVSVRATTPTKQGREPFHFAYFKFRVADKEFTAVSTPTSQVAISRLLAMPKTEVVYYTPDPSINTLRHYYDRTTGPSPTLALAIELAVSLAFALVVSALLSWRLGWLRWRAP